MPHLFRIVAGLLLVVLLIVPTSVSAHANLQKSYPDANESLMEPPASIDLAFTEPLEPVFSSITLYDANGAVVEIPPTEFDTVFPNQMFIPLYQRDTPLPDGRYIVAWRAVSRADGHATKGSFVFGINVLNSGSILIKDSDTLESIPVESILPRWVNLLAMSLMIGSIGFWLFVWKPAQTDNPTLTRLYGRLLVVGWGMWGIASLLMLVLQTSISAGSTFWSALVSPLLLWNVITQTTFGGLWLARMGLWVGLGTLLRWGWRSQRELGLRLALFVSMAILLTQSLFSHANGTQIPMAAVTSDWLHLLATSLWIGGLIAFLLTLWGLRGQLATLAAAEMVARFSNYARVAVIALIVTGLYATWLHVGSLEALFNTRYGQMLVIKLALFVPLLAIAGVNFLWTQRHLYAGREIWVGRLRGLIGLEIALTCTILVAAAALTAGSPARGVLAAREAGIARNADAAYFGMEVVNDQMIHLDITPGYVGENEFIVTPYDADGNPITDASLIRLRFENLTQDLGRSELRPESQGDGTYRMSGANLSTPGQWRIRMTVQRPGQYDTVVDFIVDVAVRPTATTNMTVPDDSVDSDAGINVLCITGATLLLIGVFSLAFGLGEPHSKGCIFLATTTLFVGVMFVCALVYAFMLAFAD